MFFSKTFLYYGRQLKKLSLQIPTTKSYIANSVIFFRYKYLHCKFNWKKVTITNTSTEMLVQSCRWIFQQMVDEYLIQVATINSPLRGWCWAWPHWCRGSDRPSRPGSTSFDHSWWSRHSRYRTEDSQLHLSLFLYFRKQIKKLFCFYFILFEYLLLILFLSF